MAEQKQEEEEEKKEEKKQRLDRVKRRKSERTSVRRKHFTVLNAHRNLLRFIRDGGEGGEGTYVMFAQIAPAPRVQARSRAGRWSWAQKVGFLLLQLFLNSSATDIVIVTAPHNS